MDNCDGIGLCCCNLTRKIAILSILAYSRWDCSESSYKLQQFHTTHWTDKWLISLAENPEQPITTTLDPPLFRSACSTGQVQRAKAMPMRQCRTNPMPIETSFWIGFFGLSLVCQYQCQNHLGIILKMEWLKNNFRMITEWFWHTRPLCILP